jgi:hypothetical protein
MSNEKQLQLEMQMQEPPPREPPQKPEFKLPEGYTVGWRVKGAPGKKPVGGYVLRAPNGRELGFFEFKEGIEELGEVLKAHLKSRVVGNVRTNVAKALVVLEDSEGKEVGSWEVDKPTKNPISAMLKDLGNR